MATNNGINVSLFGQTGTGAFVGSTNPTINSSTFSGKTGIVDTMGVTSTVSAGAQTTLTASSSTYQIITGTTTQSFALPNATTMTPGQYFIFNNQSTGQVTVQTTFPAIILTLAAGQVGKLTLLTNTVSAGTWKIGDMTMTVNQFNVTTNTSGTYTPTPGTAFIIVEMCGSGGGSGGIAAQNTAGQATVSGAGGPGGYLKFLMTAAQIGTSLSYSVGLNGSGGSAGANAGFSGSGAQFGSWTAGGGAGGNAGSTSATSVVQGGASANNNTVGTGQVIFNMKCVAGESTFFATTTQLISSLNPGGANPLSFAEGLVINHASFNSVTTGGGLWSGRTTAYPGYGWGGNSVGAWGTGNSAQAGANGMTGAIFVTEYIYN